MRVLQRRFVKYSGSVNVSDVSPSLQGKRASTPFVLVTIGAVLTASTASTVAAVNRNGLLLQCCIRCAVKCVFVGTILMWLHRADLIAKLWI